MNIKNLFIVIAGLICFTGLSQEKSKYAPQLDTIFKAFESKDPNVVQLLVTKNFTINNIPPGMEASVVEQVIPQFNGYDNYTITDEKKENNGTRVKILAKNSGKNCSVDMNFLFDANGKISEFNVLESFKE